MTIPYQLYAIIWLLTTAVSKLAGMPDLICSAMFAAAIVNLLNMGLVWIDRPLRECPPDKKRKEVMPSDH